MTVSAWQLAPLELPAGFPLGVQPGRTPTLPRGPVPPGAARAAFEAVVLDALQQPPCVLSFSGGRDSSAVLAIAVVLAARHGLPAPHPVTMRFARVPSADEAEWQERVVESSGVTEWTVLEITDELDLVGPAAREQIREVGVLWPANTHFHHPIAALAAGGTLVTGFGGDEVMNPGWAWDRWNRVRTRQVRPRRGDLVELVGAHGPRWVRGAVLDRRPEPSAPSPWLTSDAQRRVTAGWRDLRTREPVRHDQAVVRHLWASRYMSVAAQSLERMAQMHDARAVHPFADPRFLSAVAAERGRVGPRSRTAAMRQLFGDALPEASLRRVGKATFNGAFWGPETRRFATGWDGSGFDNPHVDVDRLRQLWSEPDPDARTYSLLQAVWAAQD